MFKVSDKSEMVGEIIGWFDMELPFQYLCFQLILERPSIKISAPACLTITAQLTTLLNPKLTNSLKNREE